MQITHEEALRLIQFDADRALEGAQKKLLAEHLNHCEECRVYAKQLSRMEDALAGVMRKHWNLRPAPLAIDVLIGKKNNEKIRSALLVTRSAIISLAFLAFVVMGWQLTTTNHSANGTLPVLPVIPTPSTFYTATSNTLQDCTKISYHVQDGDTLASIASQFSVSEARLKEVNNFNTETMVPNAILLIPVCESTPTNTIQPPTFTITPFLQSITRTPG